MVVTPRCSRNGSPGAGTETEVTEVLGGDALPDSGDVYVLGGGEDAPQAQAAREIGTSGPLHRAVERGAPLLAVCAGCRSWATRSPIRPAALLRARGCSTSRPSESIARAPSASSSCNQTRNSVCPSSPVSRTTADAPGSAPTHDPLGTVEIGEGNGWGTEGALNGRVIGTYLHGPVLARNAALADLLLHWATGDTLEPLDDAEETALHRERVRAARERELQPRRSWKDVIRRG